ncbi:MAG: AAA family ATPase [Myxococcota bacterium]|nr:AAA family ATPase [Myxococcota bacterium]
MDEPSDDGCIYRFGDFDLDPRLRALRRGGQAVPLAPLPFSVLVHLIEHRSRVVGKRELLERVWRRQHVSDSALPTCIRSLRAALGDLDSPPGIVTTVRGVGYRFAAPVEVERPGSERTGPPGDFVGRARELDVLRTERATALAGRARAVFLVGEPGIGKTRLVEEFVRQPFREDARLLEGHCLEGEGAPPFWPWTQVLQAAGGAEGLSGLLGRAGHGVVAAPVGERFRLFEEVSTGLRSLAEAGGLVVVLEDLHRADVPSLRLFEFVLAELRATPVLFIGTYRDADLGRDAARASALGRIARGAESRFLELEGLSLGEVRELAQIRTGRPATDGVVSRLHEQSGGNPFFVTHLVNALATSSVAGPKVLARLPRGLRDAIAEQLAVLPERDREILRRAAVFGREFERAALARLCPSPLLVDPALHAAEEAHVLVPGRAPGTHRFSHMLVRDVLFAEVAPEERPALHEAAGAALERLHRSDPGAWLPVLAYHFAEAIPKVGAEKALRYAREASADALHRLAYEEAVEHGQRALAIAEEHDAEDATRCEILLALGDAQGRACRRPEGTKTLLRAARMARRIGAATHLAEAALRFAPGFFAVEAGIEDEALVWLLREALTVLGPADPALRAQLLGRLAMARYWVASRKELDELLDEAHLLATRHGDAATRVAVHQAMLVAGWSADNTDERLQASKRLVRLAEEAGDAESSLVARLLGVTTRMELGDLGGVERGIRELEARADEGREAYGIWYVLLLKAMCHQFRGELEAATRSAEEFRVLGERIQGVNVELSLAAFNGLLAWEQGHTEGIMDLATELSDRYRLMPVVRAILCRILLDVGAKDAARAQFEEVLADRLGCERRDPQWLWTHAFLAEACSGLGDQGRAERLYSAMEPYADRYVIAGFGVMCWGSTHRHLGQLAAMLGERARAADHFEEALARNRAIGARPFVAFTQYDYARLLGDGSQEQRVDARERVAFAGREARAMGLARLSRACDDLDAALVA